MAFFEGIGKKISQTAQGAIKGTRDLTEVSRLNGQILDEQKAMDSFFLQLGKKYYELHTNSADENFAHFCNSITACIEKIAALKKEVHNIKGMKKCPGCGAEIPIATLYCEVCGCETKNDVTQAEGNAVQAEGNAVQAEGNAVQAEGNAVQAKTPGTCPNCNIALPEHVSFCTGCGHKL